MQRFLPERRRRGRQQLIVLATLAAAVLSFASAAATRPGLVSPPVAITSSRNDVSSLPLRALGSSSSPETVDPGRTGGGSLVGPLESFEGIANKENAGGAANYPPDAEGAVGPLDYVQWVNSSLAIYDKTGGRILGPIPGNRVWSGFGGVCETSNNGDPIVLYDQLAERWVLSQFAYGIDTRSRPTAPFFQCVAVSTSADPTGTYYRYAFEMPDDLVNDYSKLAVWPDAYYMTDIRTDPSGRAVGAGAFAFDRAAMLAGRPASAIYFPLDVKLAGILPADLDGRAVPRAPGLFVKIDDNPGGLSVDQLELWQFSVDFRRASLSRFDGPTLRATEQFDSALCGWARSCIAQPGTAQGLDPISDRLMFRAAYRVFPDHSSLVVVHSAVAGPADHAGIAWHEIVDPEGTATIRAQGIFAPDADSRWMGSAAMDQNGDLAVGFSLSGTTTYPSIGYAGRLIGDPPSELSQGEGRLVTGTGSQTGSLRWGDYSSLSVDPADDCTFWYTQEYYPATSPYGWHTRIGSFRFPTCGALPTITGTDREGATLTASPGAWPSLPHATFAYQWRRCGAQGDTCTDIHGATETAYVLGTGDVDRTIRVLVRASTPTAMASAMSLNTGVVAPIPATQPLDLVIRLSASTQAATIGQTVTYVAEVTNATGTGSATDVVAMDVLPSGTRLESATADRGGECTGTTTITCPLDFLPGGRTAAVRIVARVVARGQLVDTASVTAAQLDPDPATNQATVTIAARGKPSLALIGAPLNARASGATTVLVASRLAVDEPVTLAVLVLDPSRQRRVPLLPGSMLGSSRLARAAMTIGAVSPHPGSVPLLLRLPLRSVVVGHSYRLIIRATDSDDLTTSLATSFRRRPTP
jgi:uncharacterized repeat protein (TIGR01451 family)